MSSTSRPVVVYLAPRPPHPLTSGMAIRQFHLLQAYAKWGRVHLVTFYGNAAEREAGEHLKRYCEDVHLFSTASMLGESAVRMSRLARIAFRLRGFHPTDVRWLHSPEMAAAVAELVQGADVLHVARLGMTAQIQPLLGSGGSRPAKVLDLDDVESSSRLRHLRSEPPALLLHRLYGYYDLTRVWRHQARLVRSFDRVFVCSERDRRRFRNPNVCVVPNGIDIPPSPPTRHTDGRTMMFCGLLSYRPNVDGIQFFVKSVFPLVQRAIRDARLLIVGRAPTPDIRALHDGTAITVAADVPSVSDYYAAATIAVAPIRFGGGTRIKILEAWAHGVPVVSTAVGCEGLDAVDGTHLMIADRARDLAEQCVSLLRSSQLRERLSTAARDLVSERYQWDAIRGRAVSEVNALLHESGFAAGAAPLNHS
jgi:polysaccharide biosynthesis protein PslH